MLAYPQHAYFLPSDIECFISLFDNEPFHSEASGAGGECCCQSRSKHQRQCFRHMGGATAHHSHVDENETHHRAMQLKKKLKMLIMGRQNPTANHYFGDPLDPPSMDYQGARP
ncbi:hypothetical protein HOY82DRAFT_602419 [Tuber indicum]|nr:hypothetical protein HOY82DRAFT_602419 [Tuber indicum]